MNMSIAVGFMFPRYGAFLSLRYMKGRGFLLNLLGLQLIMIFKRPPTEHGLVLTTEMLILGMSPVCYSTLYLSIGLLGVEAVVGNLFSFDFILSRMLRIRKKVIWMDPHGPMAEYSPDQGNHYYTFAGWLVYSVAGLPIWIRKGMGCIARADHIRPDTPKVVHLGIRKGRDTDTALELMRTMHESTLILKSAAERIAKDAKELQAELKKATRT